MVTGLILFSSCLSGCPVGSPMGSPVSSDIHKTMSVGGLAMITFTCIAFSRCSYLERLTFISFFYITEQLRINGRDQRPSSGSLVVLGFISQPSIQKSNIYLLSYLWIHHGPYKGKFLTEDE